MAAGRHLRLQPGDPPARLRPRGRQEAAGRGRLPQGFRLTLHSPNDRYPNDSKAAQAVAQMWSRVGIRTEVEAVPWASFAQRSNRQEYAIRLSGWASVTGEASYALVNILGTFDREKRTGPAMPGAIPTRRWTR
ncbi:ABC transporter substrate-binding protein [Paeniroseomonas aquatica]|uniref:ABC transporter substrate-binding protein n=1 Tax=Paeniroseomonas aquatica TaxID=373043 RepID=UPI003619611D